MLRGIIKTALIAGFFIGGVLGAQFVWAKILITEVNPGISSTTDEFVELYNSGSESVDISSWKLEKINSSGHSYNLVNSFVSNTIVNPFSYFLIGHNDYQVVGTSTQKDYKYSTKNNLAWEDDGIFLYDSSKNINDWLFWGEINSSTYQTQNQQAIPTTTILQHGQSFIRHQNSDGSFQDTENNRADFVMGEVNPQNSFYNINTTTSPYDYTPSTTLDEEIISIPTSTSDNITTTTTSTSNITTSTIVTSTSTSTISTLEQTNTTTTTTSTVEQLSNWTVEQWNKIKINEFVANPQAGNEWVELFNTATNSVNLSDGSICDNRLTGCKTVSGTIAGRGWLVIDLKTKSFLNNDGDSVVLLDPDDDEMDRIDYSESFGVAEKGQSLARKQDGVDTNTNSNWAVTTQITKQTTNVIVAPVVPTSEGGSSQPSNTKTQKQINTLNTTTTTTSSTSVSDITSSTILTTGNIILSEIYPNPIGADKNDEYIRITNLSSSTINLVGWKLADLTKSYKLSGIILSGQSIVWKRTSTTIALNNTKVEVVSLTDPNNKLVDKVGYNKANEGMVYRRYGEEWRWEELNPVIGVGGNPEEDMVTILDANQAEIEELVAKLEKQADKGKIIVSKQPTVNSKSYLALSLLQAREADKGELVVVRGVVSVLPNIFGSQYFYITDGKNGLQIYNHKKEFIDLRVGDLIEVRGKISNANGINRLITSSALDIDVLSINNQIKINSSTIDELSEYNLGGLIKITGLITEIKSTYMYLDDGADEIKIVFKTGANIDKTKFKEGDRAEVIGVLEAGKDGWQLWSRSNDDIKLLGESQYLVKQEQTLKSAPNSSVDKTSKYLEVTAGGLGSLILGFLIRAHGSLILGGIKKATIAVARIIGRG